MGLVRCPDCGKNISDSAPACIGCGRPMQGAPGAVPARPLASTAESPGVGPRCGKCGGTAFKKFSLLYDESRSQTAASTQGAALGITSGGGIGVGVGGATSTGTSTTFVARRVAPPDRKQMARGDASISALVAVAAVLGALGYAAAGFVWAFVAFAIALFGGAVVAGTRSAPELERRYRAAYAEWDRKYMCMQCGAVARASGGEGQPLALETDEGDGDLDALIRAGQKIQAVKHVRETTGLGLAEAVEVVEARTRQL
jgi:DNA-directed RNA polymerase subunit RPC12/RpoP